jgi:flagellar biosynthetic protein FlhB
MDLQLFAEEKTEKATPKKRRDARERGFILKSMELNTMVVLLSAFMGIKALGPAAVKEFKLFFIDWLDGGLIPKETLNVAYISNLALNAAKSFILVTFPLMLMVAAAGFAINFVQTGFMLSSKAMGFKLNRLNPLEGLKRIFSLKGLVQLLKAILKIIIIGYTAYKEFRKRLDGIPGIMGMDITTGISYMLEGISSIALNACIAFAILSVLDYLYQWWSYERELRMTKQEVKEEFKQMEGDPKLKGRIRQKQREIGMRRMMHQVPDADVVITNPTHFAVALLYDEATGKAPVVVAKGRDFVALRIKKVAEEHNVHIVEDKPLARSLYESTEIGEEIPIDMYKAVAEILAYVYRMKKKQ